MRPLPLRDSPLGGRATPKSQHHCHPHRRSCAGSRWLLRQSDRPDAEYRPDCQQRNAIRSGDNRGPAAFQGQGRQARLSPRKGGTRDGRIKYACPFSPLRFGHRLDPDIPEINRLPLRLQGDIARRRRSPLDFVLQHAIHPRGYRVALANDVIGVPFAGSFLR